ncbi:MULTISPECIES: hypothetical protein [Cyanophyceae]|uniref:Uncharacterized protein n=1 Tax=Leptolyngbya subtilissima DQ-A4 TaxID=2933933 RepID=A0ABV0KEC7_9CYAN|nr:hypothetical protein [Nodosilinea sp. FACHB-141]MBD2111740.1 hypothetical protein [Nodosilinea sp. FACHB-141]
MTAILQQTVIAPLPTATARRTYLATLADGSTARVTVAQGYHPALGGGEIAQVKAAIALPILALAIVG